MDIRLHYIEKGSGDVLILLHGNGEDLSYFEYQMEVFSKHFRVIAVDSRGHGQSPRGNTPFSLAQFAEDLHDFMKEMGIPRASLLGFSDGGNIALIFALKYPDMVEQLILNSANLYPDGMVSHVKDSICNAYWRIYHYEQKSEEDIKRLEMLGLMVHEPRISPEGLHGLHMPTLVIAGYDDMIRLDHTEMIHQHISGSQLVFLPGDHFLAHENPDAFNEHVLQFMLSSF